MAYFKKLFQPHKFGLPTGRKSSLSDTKSDWKKPQFDEKTIRLVLFLDTDGRGRRIVFDSKAVVTEEEKGGRWCRGPQKLTSLKEGKVQTGSVPNQKCKYSYEPKRTGSDGKMLEEMMFGAEGFAYKGTSLKVHAIRTPRQLMLTKVFIPERPKKTGLLDSEESNSFSSAPELSSIPRATSSLDNKGISHSVPMDVPSPIGSWSFDLIDEDSGLASLTSSGSFQPCPSPGSNSSSCNSLNRRWQRGMSTMLEGSLRRRSMQDILVNEITSSNRPRRCKMALGIIFGSVDENNEEANRLFENFFFSHIALMEGHLEQLRNCVEKAYYSDRQFTHRMIEGFEVFKKDMTDLYTAPRLSEPVWLNMMSFSSYKYMLCEKFMREFVGLATKYDNKNTNFFMSTVVTAVLTYHLAWVPTVMPAGGSPSNTYLDKHSAKWVDTLAKTHPYNPLWAQLGDLYGAIGFPLKLSRTVIVGKKADLVKKMLYILSYFIRCSDVLETGEYGSLETFLENLHFAETPSEYEKYMVPSTPTPVNSFGATPQSPTVFCSLPLDSLLSDRSSVEKNICDTSDSKDCNSNDRSSLTPNAVSSCSQCEMNRKSGDFTESKVGKSVFYVEPTSCGCDSKPSQTRNSSKPNPKESYNLEDRGGEHVSRDIQKKKESLRLTLTIPNQESLCSNNSDKTTLGAYNTDSKTSLKPCKLSTVDILDNPRVNNIQHVRKSSDVSRYQEVMDSKGVRTDSLKSETGLAMPENFHKVLSKEEIRNLYRESGSNSMFNEYFDADGVEAKTIDDVDEKDRVVDLPVKKKHLSEGEKRVQIDETSNKAPSLPDLTASQGKADAGRSHRIRLGSLDQTYKLRRPSMSRQISENAPGRCRPVTPTELGKRRHMSSTSSFDIDLYDPRSFCQELPMPGLGCEFNCTSQKDFEKNFGRSLLADFSDHYMSDFVLHGTSDKNCEEKLIKDLRMATQYSVLDEPIAEAVFIVADTDNWTVKQYSSQHTEGGVPVATPCLSSHLISNLLESVVSMSKLKMSPEFCVMHLEDRLQEIYFKSKMLAEYLSRTKNKNIKELLTMLGFDRSDLPLLVAIAGTHTPNFPLVCLS